MTTPDEMKRAVDRLLAAPIGTNALSYDFLLSERAELLATVGRMRGALEAAQSFIADGGLAEDAVGASIYHQVTAALTTGEATNMVAPVAALSSKPVDDTGEANSSVKPTVEAVAWLLTHPDDVYAELAFMGREPITAADREAGWTAEALVRAHPAPIKPSADTGELRERVAASIGSAWAHGTHGKPFDVKAETDAILDLIQSKRAGNNANGLPIFGGHADGITNITLLGWTCFGPDEEGQRALAGFQSERP